MFGTLSDTSVSSTDEAVGELPDVAEVVGWDDSWQPANAAASVTAARARQGAFTIGSPENAKSPDDSRLGNGATPGKGGVDACHGVT